MNNKYRSHNLPGRKYAPQGKNSQMCSIINRSIISQGAEKYRRTFIESLPTRPLVDQQQRENLQPMNPVRGKQIADAFESMQHTPHDLITRASYQQLCIEVQQQYEFAEYCMGISFEPWLKNSEPYRNSNKMFADVYQNRHLYFLTTADNFGSVAVRGRNYMLNVTDTYSHGYQLLVNDMFRAVHDLYGHAMKGYGFGPKGEEKAWYEHLYFFSLLARPAITTETRGQNTWVNYGPHLRDPRGQLPTKGDPNWIPFSKRPFAPQKIGILPAHMSGVSLQSQNGAVTAHSLKYWTPNIETQSISPEEGYANATSEPSSSESSPLESSSSKYRTTELAIAA